LLLFLILGIGAYKLAEKASVTTEKFVGRIEAIEKIGTTTVTGVPGMIGSVTDVVVIRVEQN
jgi:hypothetical protein